MQRITRHAAAATLAAAVLFATGCSGNGDDDKTNKVKAAGPATVTPDTPKASSPAAPTTKAEAGTTAAAAPGAAVAVPKPDAATQAKYVADLDAIDPAIVNGKADRAVSRGRDQCTSIKQWPGDDPKLIALVDQRFTTPNGPMGAAKAKLVLAVVRKHICPGF
ncbi:hypothetical protein [Embleya sp. NPDC020886]|uniref:hypothetical protein n=1 Tax=Embleya sp. NPDC020886 TaxID=3363980 RepID=UPI00379C47FE